MNKKLDNYFATQNFDIEEPPFGHMERFEKRLKEPRKKKYNFKWLSLAASLLLLVGIWTGTNLSSSSLALADVSPQMQEAESFFVATIKQEIKEIEKFRNPSTERIINDALNQLKTLEKQYKKLVTDLNKTNNDKRIIYAMIRNYQSRIEVLQDVLKQIDEIKNPKNTEDEEIYI
ncbi:hypothetical protein GCM10011416_22180 [Polaribacter pacificus]|uniref:Uncharacterized protein n=1 Tax=Polaribacter pacificus TaxID=1775173 RepID=A0A917I269_9FLAO|nr:hypothetical protein [Polaribacter pacificus]GGH02903.1 hypothetical protein GCM10011416_22180 [Polaribacter pacificus]